MRGYIALVQNQIPLRHQYALKTKTTDLGQWLFLGWTILD